MAKLKNEKDIKLELWKQVKKLDWDTLAYEIILLETAVAMEKDYNYLKLLGIKLEIWENEKKIRVSDHFNMEYFLNKDYGEDYGYTGSDPFE